MPWEIRLLKLSALLTAAALVVTLFGLVPWWPTLAVASAPLVVMLGLWLFWIVRAMRRADDIARED